MNMDAFKVCHIFLSISFVQVWLNQNESSDLNWPFVLLFDENQNLFKSGLDLI